VTAGAADVTFGSPSDGFVAKLNDDGSQLVYATYIGRMVSGMVSMLLLWIIWEPFMFMEPPWAIKAA